MSAPSATDPPPDNGSSRDSLDLLDRNFGDPVYPGTQASATAMTMYKRKVEECSKEVRSTMKECNLHGRELWIQFTCAFRVPTIQNMPAMSHLAWIMFLKTRSVKVNQSPGYPYWKALRHCLLCTEFPEGDIGDSSVIHDGRLNFREDTNRITSNRGKAALPMDQDESHSNRDGNAYNSIGTPSFSNRTVGSSSTCQGVSTIIKAYTSRNKFKGKFDDDLNAAIEQFETMASVFDLSEKEKAKAFPTILDGSAFKHYARVYRNRFPSYEEQIRVFRENYISPEQQQRVLQKWEKHSITEMMRNHPNKSEMEVFRHLCDDLCSIQMRFPTSYHDDILLLDKLLFACDIPHIHELLLDRVPQSSQEAMQRVAARLSCEPRSPGINNTELVDEVPYSLEKRYGGDSRRKFKGYTKSNWRSDLSRKLASQKGCWVCQGQHLARNNHSSNEILDAIGRIKSAPSTVYITELLSDYEWALSDDPIKESNIPTNEYDSTDEAEGEDQANLTLRNLEIVLSNTCFVHGRGYTADISREVEVMSSELDKRKEEEFDGVVIDTGANRSSVVGFSQFTAYCKEFHIFPKLEKVRQSNTLVGLGGHAIQAVGVARIPIPFVQMNLVIDVEFKVVKDNTTSILSLKDLKINGLDISVQRDKIIFNKKEQNLLFENDLLKHKWKQNNLHYILYTTAELEKLHRSFGHPLASALQKLLKRASITEVNAKTRDTIDSIVRRCNVCQKYSSSPRRFKINIGTEDLMFKHVVAVDLMFISKKPVLHVVDEATHFMGAQFLRSHSSADVWKALLRCWPRLYLGPPDHLRIDQGSNFISQEFLGCASTEGITVLQAPIESPTTMSHVESYHGSLRRAYLKIWESLPRRNSDSDCLQLAVKIMNDTVGPEGLCPTILVFGSLPRAARRQPAATQLERAKALDGAREELLKEYAKRRIAFAQSTPVPRKQKSMMKSYVTFLVDLLCTCTETRKGIG